MNQITKLIEITKFELDFFQQNGELPFAILLAASPLAIPVVCTTVNKIVDFWVEYLEQYPADKLDLMQTAATKISFGHDNEDNPPDIIINPDMLILVLSYTEDRERVITLELAGTPTTFTLH